MPRKFGLVTALCCLPVSADLCNTAYEYGCFRRQPFKGCCNGGECQSAESGITCEWGFGLPCCPELMKARFQIPLSNALTCQKACDALGSKANGYMDFCPDGRLHTDPHVAACPEAMASLRSALNSTGDHTWCASKVGYSCTWSYKQKDELIHGKFHWHDSDSFASSCERACRKLGDPLAKTGDYCETSNFEGLEECYPALANYTVDAIPWCGLPEALYAFSTGTGHHEISHLTSKVNRSAAVRSAVTGDAMETDLCKEAFAQKCWQKGPFAACCDTCVESSVKHDCKWKFGFNDGSGMQIISNTVTLDQGGFGACDTACDVLGDESNDPFWYCDVDTVVNDERIAPCSRITDDFRNITVPWCGANSTTVTVQTPSSFMAATGISSSHNPSKAAMAILPLMAAILALMAAIAFVVKFHSRRHVREESSQSLLGVK